jgi:hypothetical protein
LVIYSFRHVCIDIYICIYIYIYMHVCMHVYIYMHVCVCVGGWQGKNYSLSFIIPSFSALPLFFSRFPFLGLWPAADWSLPLVWIVYLFFCPRRSSKPASSELFPCQNVGNKPSGFMY